MNNKKIILMTLMVFPLLVSCNHSASSGTIKVIDMIGTEVTVPLNPKKVACISRTTYDLLVSFGLGDNIDGAYSGTLNNKWISTIYPNYKKHYVYGYNDSIETFYSRGVDLVFAPEKNIADNLNNHGIPALCVSLYGNPTFDNYVNYFADLTSTLWPNQLIKEKCEKWKNQVASSITSINNELSKHQLNKQKVYYVRGDKNKGLCYTDTIGSFTEFAYRSLGLEFVKYQNNTPTEEEVIKTNPDIIVIGGIYQRKNIDAIKKDTSLVEVNAVKNNKIYNIPIGLTAFEQLSTMTPIFFYDQANKIYPEYFNYDVHTMIKDSIKDNFNVSLTSEQIQYMRDGLGPNGEELV